jgi:hypothetical protein
MVRRGKWWVVVDDGAGDDAEVTGSSHCREEGSGGLWWMVRRGKWWVVVDCEKREVVGCGG